MTEDFFADRSRPTTLAEGLDEAHWIIRRAMQEFGVIRRSFLMISGGNDSMVLFDVCSSDADEIVHINTGIGVPETNEFVRKVVAGAGLELTEAHPPRSYRELVLDPKLFGGFPGPGAHGFIYARLKERCVRQVIRGHRTKNGQRFMLLTGIRNDESKRRMGYATAINRTGGQVWVNPLLRWSNDLMAEYRTLYDLPVNEVTKHLHMSGECLCGAFAHPGELDEIALFYPHVAETIRDLERDAREAGLRSHVWGGPRTRRRPVEAPGPLCAGCILLGDIPFDEQSG